MTEPNEPKPSISPIEQWKLALQAHLGKTPEDWTKYDLAGIALAFYASKPDPHLPLESMHWWRSTPESWARFVNLTYTGNLYRQHHFEPTTTAHSIVSQESERLRERSNQLMVECEGLKSQIISLQRELHSARRSEEYLQAQNEKQLEYIGDLAKATRALQAVLIASTEKRLCMHATHVGIVTELVGDELSVSFETPEGELEQIYNREQFVHKILPQPGDRLEAHVFVAHSPAVSPALLPQDTDDEFAAFQKKGVRGPVDI